MFQKQTLISFMFTHKSGKHFFFECYNNWFTEKYAFLINLSALYLRICSYLLPSSKFTTVHKTDEFIITTVISHSVQMSIILRLYHFHQAVIWVSTLSVLVSTIPTKREHICFKIIPFIYKFNLHKCKFW